VLVLPSIMPAPDKKRARHDFTLGENFGCLTFAQSLFGNRLLLSLTTELANHINANRPSDKVLIKASGKELSMVGYDLKITSGSRQSMRTMAMFVKLSKHTTLIWKRHCSSGFSRCHLVT
jgi:hypothetical protein